MNESNIRLAIFYIPPVVAATIFMIKWQTGRIAAKKEIAVQAAKENSLGETKVTEINRKLEDAKIEREAMKEALMEMKDDFKEMKEDFKYFKEEIRKHGIDAINETISKLERLNKNK